MKNADSFEGQVPDINANSKTQTANSLQASSICHGYGEGEVLKGLSLEIGEGEFVALMGPSGSGKSTFLHLAAGLLVPASGKIVIGGTEVTALGDSAAAKFRRRHVGVVFQAFNLIESMTVAENIRLPARLDHAKLERSRLGELVEKLHLQGKENKLPSQLSGGERQRVAIARALYMRPDVVLADEPTGNLDAKSAHSICELLSELNKTERSAILLVTHDPFVAAAATRVCFLKDGAIACSHPTNHDATAISRLYLETCQ